MSREEFEGKYSMPEKHLVDAPEGIKIAKDNHGKNCVFKRKAASIDYFFLSSVLILDVCPISYLAR